MIRAKGFIIGSIFLVSTPTIAIELASPVECALGSECFIQQYVDHDSSSGARDPMCGPRTYDAHKGTDFALPDRRTMQEGVSVLAAADGVIVGFRDGMADGAFAAGEAVEGRECGNGLLIKHSDGWTTQYCHLKRGSVTARKGRAVKAGAFLGEIGMSGQAEFPHLHLQVKRGDQVIDPFDSSAMSEACDVDRDPLWSAESGISYTAGGVLGAGIVSAAPEYDEIKRTSPHSVSLNNNVPALVLWGHAFGVETGDVMSLSLRDQSGKIVAEQAETLEKNQARTMRFVGRRKRGESWPSGTYVGTVKLLRRDEVIAVNTVRSMIR